MRKALSFHSLIYDCFCTESLCMGHTLQSTKVSGSPPGLPVMVYLTTQKECLFTNTYKQMQHSSSLAYIPTFILQLSENGRGGKRSHQGIAGHLLGTLIFMDATQRGRFSESWSPGSQRQAIGRQLCI